MSFITLIRPPFAYSKGAVTKPVALPIGAAYLVASLREAKHDVRVIDALGEGIGLLAPTLYTKLVYHGLSSEAIIERIPPQTNGIAISSMFSLEWPHTEDIILNIHRRFPDTPIILGGEHATAVYEYIFKNCPAVSVVVLGEGEETLCELADYLDSRRDLRTIAGIAYREGDVIVKTAPRRRWKDIDSLPLPAWALFPVSKYHEYGYSFGTDRGKSMPILATRGCPYQCTFCSSPLMWTTRYYVRTPSKVVDEIELYIEKYKASNIDFYDLTAIIKREWIIEFCKEILKRNLRFTWQLPAGTRSEALDKEVLEYLYNTGCRNLCYAPESGSEKTLRDIKKVVCLTRLNQSVNYATHLGISVKVNLVIGFPKETRQDIFKTLKLLFKYAWDGVDDASVLPFTPYPGSELYQYLSEKKVIAGLNNDYFASLAYLDFTAPYSYCENVGARELNGYRIIGLALFYLLTYLRKPVRIFRTLKNMAMDRSETNFEQRVAEMLKRRRGVRKVILKERGQT